MGQHFRASGLVIRILGRTDAYLGWDHRVRNMFKKIFKGISRTREQLSDGLKGLMGRSDRLDHASLETLEETLLAADVGFETTERLVAALKRARTDGVPAGQVIRNELADVFAAIVPEHTFPARNEGRPHVMLVVGVNGAGKTTTIGKLAARYQAQGNRVMLAAGDTFRAAAVEQLEAWAERLDCPIIAQETGSDSASVLFDAISAARARGADVLLADTAGRLQNKSGLMDELRKVIRVMQKVDPSAPHEVLLVLDGTTGQNAVSQLKEFSEAVGVTGLVVTKLDGTARGGIVFRLVADFGLPVHYIGVGEAADDLQPFVAREFVDALLGPVDGQE